MNKCQGCAQGLALSGLLGIEHVGSDGKSVMLCDRPRGARQADSCIDRLHRCEMALKIIASWPIEDCDMGTYFADVRTLARLTLESFE